MRELNLDAAVIGGGLGGVAAAMAMLESGLHVFLSEEHDWLGGQVSTQAVPPDENREIETVSGTKRYLAWRNRVRDYYRRNYPLHNKAKQDPLLNPGGGSVSSLCHEPKVAAAVFDEMLAGYVTTGQLTLLKNCTIQSVEVEDKAITSLVVADQSNRYLIKATYILDATELGDLLPLSGTDYVTGSEAKADTGEDHAAAAADPLDMQAITWCFAMARGKAGENHVIDKPEMYDCYKQHLSDFWPGTQLQWDYTQPISLETVRGSIDPGTKHRDLWTYRKIFTRDHYPESMDLDEITLVNWPQNDYWFGSIVDVSPEERKRHLEQAKEISRCWFYWLQTEAEREDGGIGYPELYLRPDSVGTEDGFAKAAYIRESRRIKALYRVTEADVGYDMRKRVLDEAADRGAAHDSSAVTAVEARQFHDSVGIGYYRIDLHPSCSGRNYIDIQSLPFQIPLGSLIPQDRENLLAANKNIGTTHITNGCYRLHPVEWNIGEACGHVVAYCLRNGYKPADIYYNDKLLKELQAELKVNGIPLAWPKEMRAGL